MNCNPCQYQEVAESCFLPSRVDSQGREYAPRCPIFKRKMAERQFQLRLYGSVSKDHPIPSIENLDYSINPIKKEVDEVMSMAHSRLYLYSPPGTGKTTILQSLFIKLLEKGLWAHYLTWRDLCEYWQNKVKGENVSKSFEFIECSRWLIIDEFADYRISEFGNKEFSAYLRSKPHQKIYIASNLYPWDKNPSLRPEGIDGRLLSALKEFFVIKYQGKDCRKPKKGK